MEGEAPPEPHSGSGFLGRICPVLVLLPYAQRGQRSVKGCAKHLRNLRHPWQKKSGQRSAPVPLVES